jgi:hypothetical protein
MSDFEARHRSFYETLNRVFNEAMFKRRFEPKRAPLHVEDLHVISLPEDTGEGPTPQREAMAGDMVEEYTTESGRKIKRLLDGSVLELLNTRGSISGDQYTAGWSFFEDWYYSGMAASGAVDTEREVVDGGQHKPVTDKQLDAMFRWKRAIQAVGMVHSKALICLVLLDETPKSYGRRVYKRTQEKQATVAGITALVDALTALDYHYYGQRKTPRTQSSHLPDYKPTQFGPQPEEDQAS